MVNFNSSAGNRHAAIVGMQDEPPFTDFNEWFANVIQEVHPSLVVGIARGAVRLLQLQNAHSILHEIPLISDNALPFIADSEIKSKRILLFDDSVIFGSTMSRIKEYLEARGGIVFCSSYAVDRANFYGEQTNDITEKAIPSKFCNMPLRKKHLLRPSEIRRHHHILISSLLRRASHYNLDFPTFCLEIPEYSSSDIPYLVAQMSKTEIFRALFDVSTSASDNYGIHRYAALLKPMKWSIFPKDGLSCRPYSKGRITFMPRSGVILLTPIPQLTIASGTQYEDVKFKNEALLSLWHRLSPPCHKEDPFYSQALFRLLTSYVAMLIGQVMIQQSASGLQSEFPVNRTTLLEDDIKFVIGPANCQALTQMLSDLSKRCPLQSADQEGSEFVEDLHEPFDYDLFHSVIGAWETYPSLKPNSGELVYEMLGKVFLTLRAVTDSKESRKKNPDASRLEVGLSYEAIRQLLREACGIVLTTDDTTLGMDTCVDNGQSVPKIILQHGIWLRAFYSGEGEDSQETFQFKNVIHRAYSDLLRQRVAPLSQFHMHKVCVTLKDLFPWLPISSRYYNFGRYARIGKSEEELIPWITNPESGPLKIVQKGKKKILLVNEAYRPCVQDTWTPIESRDFYDGFQYTSTAFAELEDEPILLLSTCRTHRHAYNAVAFEAHSWLGNKLGNFLRLIDGIQLIPDETIKITSDAISSLYWCTRYISEGGKKYSIFTKRFDALASMAKRAFVKQSPSAERFWEFYVASMLDPSTDPEIEQLFNHLMPLVTQMSHLTAFITRALIDSQVLSLDKLEQQFNEQGTSLRHEDFRWLTEQQYVIEASDYNEAIKQHKVPGLSMMRTELPSTVPAEEELHSVKWWSTTLMIAQNCFVELNNALNEFCREYEVQEGDFPFSPDSTRRVLMDGSIERTFDNMYALTMDIVKSTDSEQASEFKTEVLETFRRFKRYGLHIQELRFEDTGNDAFVACSEDPIVLWDIADSIKTQGERAKKAGGQFGGTRKGLSFGTVQIVQDRYGHVKIKDHMPPHLLPRAFCMLNAVDEYCNKHSLNSNSVIVLEENCAKQCASNLKIDLAKGNRFTHHHKHFHGNCYVFEIGKYGS